MSFNQGAPGVATVINASSTLLYGNAASANALTVRQFGTGNVFSAQTTTGSTALFVGANGNVGVGTTTPTANLHVTGNIYASNAVTTANIYLTGGFLTAATDGNITKSALEFNATDNVFYTTTVNLRGLSPSIYTYRLFNDATLASQGLAGTTACSWLSSTATFGVTLPIGLYKVRGKILFVVNQAATSGVMQMFWNGSGVAFTGGITTQTVFSATAFTVPMAATGINSIDATTGLPKSIHQTALTAATDTYFYVMIDGFINVTAAGKVIPQVLNTAAGVFSILQVRTGTYIEFTMVGRQGANVNIAGWA